MAGKHRAPARRSVFPRIALSGVLVTGALLVGSGSAAASTDPIVTVPQAYTTSLAPAIVHHKPRIVHRRGPIRRGPIFHGPIRRIHHPLCRAPKIWFDIHHHRHLIPGKCF